MANYPYYPFLSEALPIGAVWSGSTLFAIPRLLFHKLDPDFWDVLEGKTFLIAAFIQLFWAILRGKMPLL